MLQLDDITSAFPGLVLADEGLWHIEPLGDIRTD
jgi:hypothetical protein